MEDVGGLDAVGLGSKTPGFRRPGVPLPLKLSLVFQ